MGERQAVTRTDANGQSRGKALEESRVGYRIVMFVTRDPAVVDRRRHYPSLYWTVLIRAGSKTGNRCDPRAEGLRASQLAW